MICRCGCPRGMPIRGKVGLIVGERFLFLWSGGYVEDASQQPDASLIKYTSSGTQSFANIFSGIGDNSDNIHAIISDASDNIYAAGYSFGKHNGRMWCLQKINSSGTVLWTRFIDGTSPESDDEANAIAIDNSGNIIVSGFTKNTSTSGDFTIAKYNPAGDTLWVKYYNSPISENDKAYDMKLDASGNIDPHCTKARAKYGLLPVVNLDLSNRVDVV